jgi:hypothetical protein
MLINKEILMISLILLSISGLSSYSLNENSLNSFNCSDLKCSYCAHFNIKEINLNDTGNTLLHRL